MIFHSLIIWWVGGAGTGERTVDYVHLAVFIITRNFIFHSVCDKRFEKWRIKIVLIWQTILDVNFINLIILRSYF